MSFAPTTVKVGDAMPTITIGDVVPAEAKADIEYKWVKADGTAAGATAEAGSYKIQLSVKADSNYQIVDGTTAVTGTTELTVTGSVTVPETIKAVLANGTYKFQAYWDAANGETKPTLTEEQVKTLLQKASGMTVESVDLSAGTAETSRGTQLTFDVSGNAGSYDNPEQLFKVSVDGFDPQYIATGGTLTGLTGVKALLPENKVADKSSSGGTAILVGQSTAGVSATLTLTKDETYVPALEVSSASFTALTNAGLSLYAQGTTGAPVVMDSSNVKYVQKGAPLLLINTDASHKGEKVVLDIDGVSKTVMFDATTGAANESAGNATGDKTGTINITASLSFDVYLDSAATTPIKRDAKAGEELNLGKLAAGVTLTKASVDVNGEETLEVPTGTTSVIGGDTWYTVDVADVDQGKIVLVAAYKVDSPNAGDWKYSTEGVKDNAIVNPVDYAAGTSLIYVRPGTHVFVGANDNNTLLAVADGVEGLDEWTQKVQPNPTRKGVWEVTVNHDLTAATDVKKSLSLKDVPADADKQLSVSLSAAETTPVTVDLTINATGVTADMTAKAEWIGDTTGLKVKKAECATDAIKVTVEISKNVADGADSSTRNPVGTLAVDVTCAAGTLGINVDVEGKAGQ